MWEGNSGCGGRTSRLFYHPPFGTCVSAESLPSKAESESGQPSDKEESTR
jgi:hypothetical protein